MSWTIGTGKSYNVGRQVDEISPALVRESGVKLLHLGTNRSDHTEVFEYQDAALKIPVVATRYANFHGRLLASDGTILTSTWTARFSKFAAPGVLLPKEASELITRNIESALLSHPLWPSSYGRLDLPAKAVHFIID